MKMNNVEKPFHFHSIKKNMMNIVLYRFPPFFLPSFKGGEGSEKRKKKWVSIETMTTTTATCDDDDNEDIHVARSIVNKTIFSF